VSARTLGEIAEAIGLRDHRIAYRGAPKATPAILADMLEALLAPIFVDAGFEAAAAVVERLWGERLGSQHPRRARPRPAPGMGAGPRAGAAVLQAGRPRRQRARAGVPGRGEGRQLPPAQGAG
jgi:ribonuclease-3